MFDFLTSVQFVTFSLMQLTISGIAKNSKGSFLPNFSATKTDRTFPIRPPAQSNDTTEAASATVNGPLINGDLLDCKYRKLTLPHAQFVP